MRHISFFSIFMLALASCSQQTSEVKEPSLDSAEQSISDTLTQTESEFIEEAVYDENSGIENESVDSLGYSIFTFKIGSPIEGFEHYKEKDSIIRSYNKWSYSPDAVYTVKEMSGYDGGEADDGCGERDIVVYRDDIKVMTFYDFGCADSGYKETFYFDAKGSIISKKCEEHNGIAYDEEYVYENGETTIYYSRLGDNCSSRPGEKDIYSIIRLSHDTLTTSYQFLNEKDEFDVEYYLVADKGAAVPSMVKEAAKFSRWSGETLNNIKFVKKIGK